MSTAYDVSVLSKNPLAYWPMNEVSGTTIHDITCNGFDGTTPTDGSVTIGQTGPTGGSFAVRFNDTVNNPSFFGPGRGDAISITNPGGLPAYPTLLTVEFWAKFLVPADDTFYNSNNVMSPIWWGNDAEGNSSPYLEVEFQINYNNSLITTPKLKEYNGHINYPATPTVSWSAGTWAHIAVCLNPTNNANNIVYKNGQLWVSSGSPFNNLSSQSGVINFAKIGTAFNANGDNGLAQGIFGSMCNLAIYPSVLSQADVQADFAASLLGTSDYCGGAPVPVVHIRQWASDRFAPGNFELVTVFVGKQYLANREYDTMAAFDDAFLTYRKTQIIR